MVDILKLLYIMNLRNVTGTCVSRRFVFLFLFTYTYLSRSSDVLDIYFLAFNLDIVNDFRRLGLRFCLKLISIGSQILLPKNNKIKPIYIIMGQQNGPNNAQILNKNWGNIINFFGQVLKSTCFPTLIIHHQFV